MLVALVMVHLAAPFGTAVAVAQEPPTAESVIFKASDAMGLLRGLKQEDSQTTLEFWGTGTVDHGGTLTKVSKYRGSVRFLPVISMREDFAVGAARVVRAVNGDRAWDESAPGIFTTAASVETARERQLRLASLPSAVVKAARQAGAKATVSMKGATVELTFPLTGVEGGTVTATLTNQFLIERVRATAAGVTVDSEYSKYGDHNEKDYKSDVQFPQRLVQKVNGKLVLDLTVTKTNTYNPYVIVPLPSALNTGGGKS